MNNAQPDTEIQQKRAELIQIRTELAELQQELNEFAGEYDRVVGSAEAQLDIVRQQIEELQNAKFRNTAWDEPQATESSFDADYESVEAQFRRAMDPNAAPRRPAIAINSAKEDLKSLYRRLARKFHPDTTTDPAEKMRLTVIMAQINAAYRDKNMDELLKFAEDAPKPVAPKRSTFEIKPLPNRQDILRELDEEIAQAKSQRAALLVSSLMVLKIQCSLARSRRRDLLGELAARVYAELAKATAELQALRK
jgi:hypothetical protein